MYSIPTHIPWKLNISAGSIKKIEWEGHQGDTGGQMFRTFHPGLKVLSHEVFSIFLCSEN
jgi:hypothetical protein